MFDMMAVGRRISDLRHEKDMTQMELADRMGVSHQAVSKWERGDSMPDISTLPLLASCFGVSLDSLIGDRSDHTGGARVIHSVLAGTAEGDIDGGRITMADIGDAAPVLKPSQLDNMIAKFDTVAIDDLAGIAPFVGREVLDRLARKTAEVGGIEELCGIAPFISREVLDELARKTVEVGGIDELCGIAPFISREVLNELARKAADVGGIDELCGIAPFISREVLDELAVKAAETGGLGELSGIAPFVSRETLEKMILRAAHADE